MNCTQSNNMLDDYVDGNLSASQLTHVQSHLSTCAECRHNFTQAQNIVTAMKDIPVPPAKLGYEKRVLSFLAKNNLNKYNPKIGS